jgi:putative hemolysin
MTATKIDEPNLPEPLSEAVAVTSENASSDSALSPITVRLARTDDEIRAAQHTRYKVFYEEFGAIASPQMKMEHRDFDVYDDFADHLVALDDQGQVAGTYRLIRADRLPSHLNFYTSHEFDITPFLKSGGRLLEIGRSCILPQYRTRIVLQQLWQGILNYLVEHKIDLIFGCASLHGTDPEKMSEELSYLHHFHRAPQNICPRALSDRFVDMNRIPKDKIDARRVFLSLPPLIKGYIRAGASIGDGAVIDHQFNTVDVCIIMPTHHFTSKYIKHFERQNQKTISTNPEFAEFIGASNPTS